MRWQDLSSFRRCYFVYFTFGALPRFRSGLGKIRLSVLHLILIMESIQYTQPRNCIIHFSCFWACSVFTDALILLFNWTQVQFNLFPPFPITIAIFSVPFIFCCCLFCFPFCNRMKLSCMHGTSMWSIFFNEHKNTQTIF